MKKGNKYVLILLSGGIDSAACVHYFLDEKYEIDSIFIDYGQKAREKELLSAKKIANYYDIRFNRIVVRNSEVFSSGELLGRNAFLVFTAVMYKKPSSGIISLGIHSKVPYYDCSEDFVKNINNILDGYTNGRVLLYAPFLKWDKYMIYQYCKNNKVPVHLTYSCENGTSPPCGKCLSCMDRRVFDAI
ncbi:MAG: 7-cyano-7-deazaguanine synthase [Candidatus Heimdallarchaeaceae archaeon]